jgi:hypothetical protein
MNNESLAGHLKLRQYKEKRKCGLRPGGSGKRREKAFAEDYLLRNMQSNADWQTYSGAMAEQVLKARL